jgi:hypothetical protein
MPVETTSLTLWRAHGPGAWQLVLIREPAGDFLRASVLIAGGGYLTVEIRGLRAEDDRRHTAQQGCPEHPSTKVLMPEPDDGMRFDVQLDGMSHIDAAMSAIDELLAAIDVRASVQGPPDNAEAVGTPCASRRRDVVGPPTRPPQPRRGSL